MSRCYFCTRTHDEITDWYDDETCQSCHDIAAEGAPVVRWNDNRTALVIVCGGYIELEPLDAAVAACWGRRPRLAPGGVVLPHYINTDTECEYCAGEDEYRVTRYGRDDHGNDVRWRIRMSAYELRMVSEQILRVVVR